MNLRGRLYRIVMRVAHRFHWHYAPPFYPDGDTVLWCQWCGFRAVVARSTDRRAIQGTPPTSEESKP